MAEYLLTDPGPYLRWRDRVLERLEVLYPLNPEDPRGAVVPREALDPDIDFHPEQIEDLINNFLKKLKPKTNPFLNPPQEMLEQGFDGTPYHFDAGEDLRRREGETQ